MTDCEEHDWKETWFWSEGLKLSIKARVCTKCKEVELL